MANMPNLTISKKELKTRLINIMMTMEGSTNITKSFLEELPEEVFTAYVCNFVQVYLK